MTNYSRSVLKSNDLPRPKIRLKKFGFSPIDTPANIAKKLPPQRCFKPLLIALFNFSHKRPTFASQAKVGTHSAFGEKSHTTAHTPKQVAFRMGGGITTLGAFRTFTNIPGPGIRTAYFAALGSWPGGAPEERREPAEQRCAYARRCSEASRPRRAA